MSFDWLKAIAPTIATALGGPLAGLAVAAVSKAIGVEPEKVTEVLKSGQLSGDQVAALKIAEMELQKHEKELGFRFAELDVRDRESARNMQAQTRSAIPGFLGVSITLGFFGILIGMMTGDLNISENQALLIMLGSLGTAWASVISYYFGSSRGSDAKNELLLKATAPK